ncbi:MAG: hypothetical protein A2046_03920 [Bacteroidetes bacterium GWA2_30_7]|nr:MAG: hypothetical protein A2046_03920 [Bacteroidetes bacterium GWA2_30_7]
MLKTLKLPDFKSVSNIITHTLFATLLLFSIFYYKERIFADTSYYLFKVIDHKHFWIEHNRFILVFSQLFPLISIFAGLPIKYILLFYSIGHALFQYIIFLICRNLYKQTWTGILLILLQTVGILIAYFGPMYELFYGAGLLILFTVILYDGKFNFINLLLMIFLALLIFTSHQYTYFLMIFVLLFHFETYKPIRVIKSKTLTDIAEYKQITILKFFKIQYLWKYLKVYLLMFITLICVMIFKKYTASEYEIGKTQAFINNLKYANYDFNYIKSLINFLFELYKELLVIIFITLGYYIIKKQFLSSVIYIFFLIFIISMLNISNYGFEHTRYQECVYFPLIFISCYPFSRIIFGENNPFFRNAFFSIAVFIIVLRLFFISYEGKKFSNRVNVMQNIIQQCQTLKGNKFVISIEKIDAVENVGTNWSYPIESMLISSINPSQKAVTICTDEDINYEQNFNKLTPQNYMFRKWDIYNISTLNNKYFKFAQTNYTFLNSNIEMNYDFNLLNDYIEIKYDSNLKIVENNSEIYLPVTISNNSDFPLYSNKKNDLQICYKWENAENKVVSAICKIPILTDIYKSLEQNITIKKPAIKGNYILIIELMYNNSDLFNSKCRINFNI